MHSLNHAALGHAVAAERAGRPESVRSNPSVPNAPQSTRCAPGRRTSRARSRAVLTARWRAAPRCDPSSPARPRTRRGPIPRAPWKSPGSNTESRSSPPTARRSASSRASRPATRQPVTGRSDGPARRRDVRALPPGSEEIYYFTRARAGCASATRRPTWRRRHRRDRPRRQAQALQPGRGAARAAVLLLARLLARGHRASRGRRMKRALILAVLVLAGCGQNKDEGISGGGKVIGKTVTVYSLTNDPGAKSRDFVDGEKLALVGRGRPRRRPRGQLHLARPRRRRHSHPGRSRPARDQRPADHRRDRRRDKVTVPLFNAAGILQIAPGGDRGLPATRTLLPSGKQTVEARHTAASRPTSPSASRRRSAATGRQRRGRLPRDGRGHRRDREGGRGRQRPLPRHRVVLTSSSNFVSSVISGTEASAFDSGQPALAPWAASSKPAASRPGHLAGHRELDLRDPEPPST